MLLLLPKFHTRVSRVMGFNTTFNNISVISWWRKPDTQRKLPTCHKSLTNFIIYCCITSSHEYHNFSPIRHGIAPGFVNYKKGCTRFAATSDKVYQLLARGSLRVLRLLPPLKLVAMI
jgi:hypothetical protein